MEVPSLSYPLRERNSFTLALHLPSPRESAPDVCRNDLTEDRTMPQHSAVEGHFFDALQGAVDHDGHDGHDEDCPSTFVLLEPQFLQILPPKNNNATDEGRNTCCEHDIVAQTLRYLAPPPSAQIIPDFLFVTGIKPKADSRIGVAFKNDKKDIYLSSVDSDGLFGNTRLEVGDKVIAINNRCVTSLAAPLRMIRGIIQKSKSEVSLCVRRQNGNPHYILNSVQKQSREEKLGICFQLNREGLMVSKVFENSLFANSMLTSGHRCCLINGQSCEHLGPHEAAAFTASCDRVSIISWATTGNLAMVLGIC